MAGTPAEHETTPAGDPERADYAADRAHALRTMFPRRVAALPESLPDPDGPAEDTAAVANGAAVPPRLSKKRTWVIVGAGVALILAASAAVFVAAQAAPRDETPAGVVAPVLTPPVAETAAPTESAVPSASPSPSTSASASVSPSASSSPAPAAPPEEPPAKPNPEGTNLALRGRVSVSGVEGDAWKAANAVDGDLGTRWSSAFTDLGWLVVDLGETRAVREVEVAWEHAYATSYRVETSADGKKWAPIFSTTAGAGGTVTVRQPATARYVRLYCLKRNSQYGYSVLELSVR